jgi:hypothetical protein
LGGDDEKQDRNEWDDRIKNGRYLEEIGKIGHDFY